jgi:predicted nucleic acid-binding protein
MASKVFIDANILLDLTLKREKYDVAKEIIELAIKDKIKAFITPSIVHSVGYWLTKTYGNAKSKELLLTLLADVSVIDISHEIVLNALHSTIKDIEDALQYYTALHHKLDHFITQDKELQKKSIASLPIYMPEEFLKVLYK